jgi:hypothetical protein
MEEEYIVKELIEERQKRWEHQFKDMLNNLNSDQMLNRNFTPWTRKRKIPQNNTQVSQENTPHNHIPMQTEPISPIPITLPHWTPPAPTPPPAPLNPTLQSQPLPSIAQFPSSPTLPNPSPVQNPNPLHHTQNIPSLMDITFTPHTILTIKTRLHQLHTPKHHFIPYPPPQPTTLLPIINTLTQLINSLQHIITSLTTCTSSFTRNLRPLY